MPITDLLYPLIPPTGAIGVVGIWIVISRLRNRDLLETDLFSKAFEETKDPRILGYYAQMRCNGRLFRWPHRRPATRTDDSRPPPGFD